MYKFCNIMYFVIFVFLQYSVLELDDGGVLTAASKWISSDQTKCFYPKQIKGQNPKRMVLALADLPATITDEKWYCYKNFKVLHQYGNNLFRASYIDLLF